MAAKIEEDFFLTTMKFLCRIRQNEMTQKNQVDLLMHKAAIKSYLGWFFSSDQMKNGEELSILVF